MDAWYDLGKFDPPVKEIGGKKWTEGMSYSSSGRFGNSTYNGLLSEVVGDLWFHTYTAGARDQLRRQKFDLYIAGNEPGGEGLDSAQSWRINGINIDGREAISNSWTHMSRRMPLKAGAELTWLASTLAPGFLGDCNKPLTISSRGGGDIPKRSGAPDEDEQRFFLDALRDGKTRKIGPTLVITPDGVVSGPGEVQMEKLSAPWIVAVWGGFKRPAFWGDKATAVLFTLDKGKVSWDKEGVNLPAGRFGVSSSARRMCAGARRSFAECSATIRSSAKSITGSKGIRFIFTTNSGMKRGGIRGSAPPISRRCLRFSHGRILAAGGAHCRSTARE